MPRVRYCERYVSLLPMAREAAARETPRPSAFPLGPDDLADDVDLIDQAAAGQRVVRLPKLTPMISMKSTSCHAGQRPNRLPANSLVEKGKPHKVALVAVMRKMIILANVLLRDDRKWSALAPAQIGRQSNPWTNH